jgi:CRP-like cAMP-binding protein
MSEQPSYEVIRRTTLGAELSEEECKTLAGVMSVRQLKDDEVLVEEGEVNNALHILTAGKLAVTKVVEDEPMILYILKVGEFAGTRAFVDRTPRKATLRAIGGATVYALDPQSFEALLTTHPRIIYCVMRAIFRTVHSTLMRMNMEKEQLSNYIFKQHGRY